MDPIVTPPLQQSYSRLLRFYFVLSIALAAAAIVLAPEVTATKETPPPPFWLKWLDKSSEQDPPEDDLWRLLQVHLDPVFGKPISPQTLTNIIDKVLTSSWRLVAIANLTLVISYIVHISVANWCLGIPVVARERLQSFLLFKLLLISAVVAPDTLDLLILLSWYTILSFLRSLAHLCESGLLHAAQSGQPPAQGVARLLWMVLLCDSLAAAVCVGLFHGAGWSMVCLLTCDCAILALDVMSQLLQYFQYPEERPIVNTVIFWFSVTNQILTITHFVHIWSWHGVQYTLIDGVLALHLHHAVSTLSQTIMQRRQSQQIWKTVAQLDDATDVDLLKEDICCVCLTKLEPLDAKRLGCGHVYHAACVCQVVERAHDWSAARCPLCRVRLQLSNHISSPPPQAVWRVSTEHILPNWLPAFSLEVVRRAQPVAINNNNNSQRPNNGSSRWMRRWLVLAGWVELNEEEEQVAMEQLVDMFPQVDPATLRNELRHRGSPQAVAEIMLQVNPR